jgi:ADP-ribose pyrophosphatase YjhB (NUDIX family)
MKEFMTCPHCGGKVTKYINPFPTVDIIINYEDKNGKGGIVLIFRKNPPRAWALPGGFVDYGESLEDAALREAREETGLDVFALRQFHTYSDPGRDPRHHAVSTVFTARAKGSFRALDDAEAIEIFDPEKLPENLAFDHAKILGDYLESLL